MCVEAKGLSEEHSLSYGRAEVRRHWRVAARPFGLSIGGRPLCQTACAMPPHRAVPPSAWTDAPIANRIDLIWSDTALDSKDRFAFDHHLNHPQVPIQRNQIGERALRDPPTVAGADEFGRKCR